MQGTLNAAGILAVVAATVFLLAKYSRKPRGGAVLWGVAVALLSAGISALTGLHKCGAGNPLFQWIIPSVCAACTLIFVKPKGKRWGFGTLFAVSALLLSFHFAHLVHTPAYTGNPKWEERIPRAAGKKAHVVRLWHTSLTGLYGNEDPL